MNETVKQDLALQAAAIAEGRVSGVLLKLRDDFASEALQGLLARGEPLDDPAGLTNLAYTLADAMLVARNS